MFKLMEKFWNTSNVLLQDVDGKSYSVKKSYKSLIHRAERGNEQAQFALVALYNSDETYLPSHMFKWTNHLANTKKQDNLLVQLGELYEKGIGVEANLSKALSCYEMAYNIATVRVASTPTIDGDDYLLALRNRIKDLRKRKSE